MKAKDALITGIAFSAVLLLVGCSNDEEQNASFPASVSTEERQIAHQNQLRLLCEKLKHKPNLFQDHGVRNVVYNRCETQLGMTFQSRKP